MSVIARMLCQSVNDNYHRRQSPDVPGEKYGESIRLSAVYSPDLASPNYSFSQATPYMETTMSITNPAVFGFFVRGNSYDLIFEPTPVPVEAAITNPDLPPAG